MNNILCDGEGQCNVRTAQESVGGGQIQRVVVETFLSATSRAGVENDGLLRNFEHRTLNVGLRTNEIVRLMSDVSSLRNYFGHAPLLWILFRPFRAIVFRGDTDSCALPWAELFRAFRCRPFRLKGGNITAQGNALGKRPQFADRPERAKKVVHILWRRFEWVGPIRRQRPSNAHNQGDAARCRIYLYPLRLPARAVGFRE